MTNDKVFVKATELPVREVLTNRMIPGSGLLVRNTIQIKRRIRDGSLVIAPQPKIKKKKEE